MPRQAAPALARRIGGWLRRIAGDRRGNTFVIITAAVIPMLALVGGGIDMGRGYLVKTRLQEACDAGVLATRKRVGSTVITDGVIPADASAAGNRFFNLNFRDGAYGTTNRTFGMTISSNYTILGTASAVVPTTIMKLFGIVTLPVSVACSAQFNYANTDIMMVLDTTGSMNDTNFGDTSSKIAVLRQTVKDFYNSVESSKTQGVRVRYGFVPYSTNVNVGFLLKSKWMDDQGTYEGRTAVSSGGFFPSYKWRYASTTVNFPNWMSGDSDTLVKGGTIALKMGGSPSNPSNINVTFSGCIEERATYVIDDYSNVDLSRARDLDLDTEPDSSNSATQWRPVLHEVSWLRAVSPAFTGYWSPASVDSSSDYLQASANGYSACPAKARKLAEMTASDVSNYVDSLVPAGSTYHDIGMIWGGRLISPTGIFASENGDVNGRPTMRHLIFLTDGDTAPLEFSNGTYGVEPLSQRRWNSGSKYNLTQTVEKRFAFACDQVKNRNITVWVIGFGTTVTPLLQTCAGSGHWFQASNSAQLSNAFAAIAAAIGDLRIIK
jgi:Flp pilus assembly protein TadG